MWKPDNPKKDLWAVEGDDVVESFEQIQSNPPEFGVYLHVEEIGVLAKNAPVETGIDEGDDMMQSCEVTGFSSN